jgi:TPP-dependent pyruvate/acetoin dehydrogenase alpha subunit
MTGDRRPREVPGNAAFYRQMFLIRAFETRVLELFSQGKLFGTTHTYIGQEAVAAGVLAHVDRRRDVVVSNHRCHGHYLAFADDAEGLMAELMGRTTGICGGKGGSQHLCSGNFYTNGILGGTVALAAGMALAEKFKRSGARVVVFLGDGALGEGIVYETFNMASLWSVPMLFVVENNFYAQTTPSRLQIAGDLAARPQAFAIATRHCQPASVQEVYALAAEAFAYIDEHARPYCLVLDTYRFSAHSKGDDYRPREEVAEWQARDPLQKLASELEAAERESIERQVADRIRQAVERAEAAPLPGGASLAGWAE